VVPASSSAAALSSEVVVDELHAAATMTRVATKLHCQNAREAFTPSA
jgi:hypothetical protein